MSINILIGIFILLAIAFLILLILKIRTNHQVNQMWRLCSLCSSQATPTQEYFSEEMIAGLPTPVQRYFLHAIALGTPLAHANQLKMQGRFRLGPDKSWLSMRCQELITSQGFVWKAIIGSKLLQLDGADYYMVNGLGRVQFGLWGLIPIINVHDRNTLRSSIGRLVQEFVWLPSALLPQQGVKWQALSDNIIQASLKINDEPVTLTLVIDTDGKVLQISSPRWGNQTKNGKWRYIPFGGKCHADQTFGGFTIPSQVNVGWWFGTDSYFDFFKCTIKQAKFQS
jgi:hypothetical protein